MSEKSLKLVEIDLLRSVVTCSSQFKLPKNVSVSVVLPLHLEKGFKNSEADQFLFGLRNGGIAVVELSNLLSDGFNSFTIIHRMPARVTCLYQFRYNPYLYLAKDITGRIAIFDLEKKMNEFMIIREGNQTILDTSGIWISQHEEVLVTASLYASKTLEPPIKSDLSVYSLRRDFACLHETVLPIPKSKDEETQSDTNRRKLIPFNSMQIGLPFVCLVNTGQQSILLSTD